MKPRIAIALVAAILGAGCATTRESTATAPAPQRDDPTRIEQDRSYIARVEKQARVRGVHLVWVNPPTRRPERIER